jgi:hypothetical protein
MLRAAHSQYLGKNKQHTEESDMIRKRRSTLGLKRVAVQHAASMNKRKNKKSLSRHISSDHHIISKSLHAHSGSAGSAGGSSKSFTQSPDKHDRVQIKEVCVIIAVVIFLLNLF